MSRKLTTEEFIEKARKVHGYFYDYSEVEYINASTKVKIICPEHGSFFQAPSHHSSGRGCSKCGREKQAKSITMSQDEFIERAKKIHGDKYNYSEVKYINNHTNIKIFCNNEYENGKKHGFFYQTPSSHLSGCGCHICANNIKSTTKEFVKKSKKKHGRKYDYSKVEYINCSTKVEIICPIHGSFWQTPSHHLNGNGCPFCKQQIISNKIRKTKSNFIKEARKVHGYKYDYSLSDYKSAKDKLAIICKKHKLTFYQTPDNHLHGKGCPECAKDKRKSTNLSKFGVEYSLQAKEVRDKIKNTCLSKYGVENPFKDDSIKKKWQANFQEKYGVKNPSNLQKTIEKIYITKKINKSFSSSKPEDDLEKILKENFPTVYRNYNKDQRYPFACDFYIPDIDLFIELNLYWTHGGEWFNAKKKSTKEKMNFWASKQGLQYKDAIKTFSERDVIKRKTAKKNNLNYVVLWNLEDIKEWVDAGFPIRKDWK